MLRTERAITTIATSKVYADELRDIVRKQVLIQHEWEIAVALREITELLSDLASGYAEGVGGPMTTRRPDVPEPRDLDREGCDHDRGGRARVAGGAGGGRGSRPPGLGDRARMAQAFREILRQAALAAEALFLPDTTGRA
jgi:hypothetical protein